MATLCTEQDLNLCSGEIPVVDHTPRYFVHVVHCPKIGSATSTDRRAIIDHSNSNQGKSV